MTVNLGGARTGYKTHVPKLKKGQDEPYLIRDATFPYDTFLHLLFGHRSLTELRHILADSEVRGNEGRALLKALFPKPSSNIWPMG
jgi:hypothetical protein